MLQISFMILNLAPYTCLLLLDGVFNNRFKLVFRNDSLGNDTLISDESVVVFTQNEELKISATREMTSVEVF